MTKKEIGYNNKIIAEFMGGKDVDWFAEKVILFPHEHQRHLGLPKTISIQNYHTWAKGLTYSEIKYNSDWGWLMPVIEEIEKLGMDTVIDFRHNPNSKRKDKMFHWCQIGKDKISEDIYGSSIESKIDSTYIAVIKFVQLFNKKRKNGKKRNYKNNN